MKPKRKVEVYANDVKVLPRYKKGRPDHLADCKRGEIKFMSRAAWNRMVFLISNSEIQFQTMLTLTLSSKLQKDISGVSVRAARKAVLKQLRRWFVTGEFFWVLEFQTNGTPHLHMWFEDKLPDGFHDTDKDGKKFNREWSEKIGRLWVRSLKLTGKSAELSARVGTRIEPVRKPNGAARYAAKESGKRIQKAVPSWYKTPGRFWGCSRGIKAELKGTEIVYEEDLCHWENECHETGEKYTGPYSLQFGLAERITELAERAQRPKSNTSTRK